MAIGWKVLATPGVGFVNGFLHWAFEPLGIFPELNIHSFAGLIFVYVLHNVPYACVPIAAALRNLDPNLEEAARLAGARPSLVLRTVALPAIAPALLAGFVLTTVIGFSLYSVPVIIGAPAGIEILSVRIIQRSTTPIHPSTTLRRC
jgi:iron(III) transport system permease protein